MLSSRLFLLFFLLSSDLVCDDWSGSYKKKLDFLPDSCCNMQAVSFRVELRIHLILKIINDITHSVFLNPGPSSQRTALCKQFPSPEP